MGLREQIKVATNDSEVASLLSKGKTFEFASERTKQSWRSTAKFRLAQLSSGDVTRCDNHRGKSIASVESKKVKTKSKKKTN